MAVVFLQIILIATLIGRFRLQNLPQKHLFRPTKGSKIPMQIRDPEAQPHLPTGSLAKNLAHLTYSFQNCVSNSIMATQHYHHSRVFLPNKQVTGAWFFFCLKGKHFFTVYLDVSSEGKTSEEGSLDMNTYTCQEKNSQGLSYFRWKNLICDWYLESEWKFNLLVCSCKWDFGVMLQGPHLVLAHL